MATSMLYGEKCRGGLLVRKKWLENRGSAKGAAIPLNSLSGGRHAARCPAVLRAASGHGRDRARESPGANGDQGPPFLQIGQEIPHLLGAKTELGPGRNRPIATSRR